jgi:uncharacterized repeat protein (TIGR03803 family)
VLFSFTGGLDGRFLGYAKLIMDNAGALYGTAQRGGTAQDGVVFKLAPPAAGQSVWTQTVLHSFLDTPDGAQPEAGLFAGPDGKLYGTTFFGGTADESGTVFSIAP